MSDKKPKRADDRPKQWSMSLDSSGRQKLRSAGVSKPQLDAGAYRVAADFAGPFLTPYDLRLRDLVRFDEEAIDRVLDEISKFRSSKERYRKMRIHWQRGILLHGPQGTGKTGTVAILAADTIANDGVVIFLDGDPNDFIDLMPVFRVAEEGRPIMVVMEDLDSLLANYEEEILDLLDGGKATVEGVLYLATTNYVDEIPARIKDRPSRFDTVVEIGYPSASNRLLFLRHVIPAEVHDEIDLQRIADKTDGMALSHIKEAAVSVYVYDKPLEECIEKLRCMSSEEPEEPEEAENDDEE